MDSGEDYEGSKGIILPLKAARSLLRRLSLSSISVSSSAPQLV